MIVHPRTSRKDCILKILTDTVLPLSNNDIKKELKEIYDKETTPSTIGNILWKGKKDGVYSKIGSGKWSKWVVVVKEK